jgi:hypothetical protein
MTKWTNMPWIPMYPVAIRTSGQHKLTLPGAIPKWLGQGTWFWNWFVVCHLHLSNDVNFMTGRLSKHMLTRQPPLPQDHCRCAGNAATDGSINLMNEMPFRGYLLIK